MGAGESVCAVRALARNAAKLPVHDARITVIQGDARDPAVVEELVRGSDVVIATQHKGDHRILRNLVARRPGDIAASLADPSLSAELLGWKATRDLDAMCRDAWAWQSHLAGRNSGK